MVCIDTNVIIDLLKGRKTVTDKIISRLVIKSVF
jgi:predicted nucleic acid-binding protein